MMQTLQQMFRGVLENNLKEIAKNLQLKRNQTICEKSFIIFESVFTERH